LKIPGGEATIDTCVREALGYVRDLRSINGRGAPPALEDWTMEDRMEYTASIVLALRVALGEMLEDQVHCADKQSNAAVRAFLRLYARHELGVEVEDASSE
jgi:hypothetical protein